MILSNVNTSKTSSLHLLQYRHEIFAPLHNHRLALTLQILHHAAKILLRLSTYLVHIDIHQLLIRLQSLVIHHNQVRIRRERLQHRSPN
jgi:hypothetical protein